GPSAGRAAPVPDSSAGSCNPGAPRRVFPVSRRQEDVVGQFSLVREENIAAVDRGAMMAEFGAFAEQAMPGLLRYGYALTGSTHDAADLVQSVLERIGSRWSKVRRADDPLAYVRRAMANGHVSRWRRHRHEIPVEYLPERPGQHHDR